MSQTKRVLAAKHGASLIEVTLNGPGGVALATGYVVKRPDTPEAKSFDSRAQAEAHFNEVTKVLAR